MVIQTAKIIISEVYNLDSINNVVDILNFDDFLFIISKDLVFHIVNRNNNQVYSFKIIILEKENDGIFELIKVININKVEKNIFKANLLIKNVVKGIYLINVYLIASEDNFKILLNDFEYIDFKFLYFINNDLLYSDIHNEVVSTFILVDKGIYNINTKQIIYKAEDISKYTYLEIKDIILVFLIDKKLFIIDKKGFFYIFEIIDDEEKLKFIKSVFLDNFYHKNIKNIKYLMLKNKILFFLDSLVYVINDFNSIDGISVKKYYFFELFKDFYTFDIDYLNLNLLEKIRGFIFYENNYYLLFENQLILFDDDNFKLVKVKELELGENLVKLKIIENLNILAVFETKIIIQNIFENSLANEIKLVFNRKLLFNQGDIKKGDNKNKQQFKIKEKLTFEEINDFLEQDNDNLIYFFNLISIQKYDNFYLFFFDIPFLFAVYEDNKLYFYPILFIDVYENFKNNYDKPKIISNISNLIFFKFEEQYYCGEVELILDNYPKFIIKDFKLLNIKEEEILKKPISFIDNKVFFLYQNNLYFLDLKYDLDKDEIKNEIKLIENSENIISNINYFDDSLFYSFFVNENQVVFRIYELASNAIKNELVFENVADKYRNLLIDSVILNFKVCDNTKFYLQIFKNNYIYNLELIIDDSSQNFKLLNYFDLSLENISKILRVSDIIFIYCDKGLYYFEPNLNYLNLIDSFEITKKVNLESDLELNLFNNLIISGKIEELSKWEKILITNEKILDLIFYQDKAILAFENYIAVYNLNNLLNLKSKDFMQFLEFDNIIYLNRYFENKILKEDKLFLLDDIGNFSVVNIKTGEIFKTYLGYLNEGKLVLMDNNIYILTKEGYYIKVEQLLKLSN
jgi:hypothetical protein